MGAGLHMQGRRGVWGIGGLALFASSLLLSCEGCGGSAALPTGVSEPSPPPVLPSGAPGAVASDAPDRFPTSVLTPTPIHVGLDDLPQPFATDSARKSPDVVPMPSDARLNVPEGFTVRIFADGLDKPRWLARAPDGSILVTETRENRIRRLVDEDGDGVADTRSVFANAKNGLDIPFGMAFAGDSFFVGNHDGVLRFPFASGQTSLGGQGAVFAPLPGGGYNQHWTRNVVASPDGRDLFVSIGSETNVDVEALPRASVQTIAVGGGTLSTFASGLRNPVGLAIHPKTGDLYCTVNERDGLGDDLVPDYFTRIEKNDFYGWPYAYLTPDNLDPRHVEDGQSADPSQAARTKTPDVLFQAHSAALGVTFYQGSTFPERYRSGAFVAFRGSWNRSEGTGYKLVYIPFEGDRPVGHYEDFLTGFLVDPSGPTTWGRPVGLLALPDGSLLFTEEMNGRIFRIQYEPG